jgi:hypothetical protein
VREKYKREGTREEETEVEEEKSRGEREEREERGIGKERKVYLFYRDRDI